MFACNRMGENDPLSCFIYDYSFIILLSLELYIVMIDFLCDTSYRLCMLCRVWWNGGLHFVPVHV